VVRHAQWFLNGATRDRLGQVVIHGTSGTGTGGSPYWVGLGQGGLQIKWDRLGQWTGLFPAEPVHFSQSGTTRPWKVGRDLLKSSTLGPRTSF